MYRGRQVSAYINTEIASNGYLRLNMHSGCQVVSQNRPGAFASSTGCLSGYQLLKNSSSPVDILIRLKLSRLKSKVEGWS